MMDTTGAFKDSGQYLRAAWTLEPMVHVLPHWNWPGKEGQPIDVRVYSNTEEVELLLNGRSLGRQPLAPYAHAQWSVPYAPGELLARGYKGGVLVASQTVASTGAPYAVAIESTRSSLQADGRDVAVLELSVRDAQGRIVPLADDLLKFEVSGPLQLLGMGNGDPGSHEADKPTERYRFAALSDWSLRDESRREALADATRAADASLWRDPFQWTPPEKRPAPAPFAAVRLHFPRPTLAAGERAELFVAEIVAGQQLRLNGAPVTARPSGDGLLVLTLESAQLKDNNELVWQLQAPAGGMQALVDAAQGGARWAQLRLTTPAGPWQRHAFNGRAQLIVQATKQPGQAVVTVSGAGLQAARLQIEVK
jgi:beta-galactosidase